MRIFALIRRIVRQFLRDKRSLALIMLAPLMILGLVSLIFNGSTYKPKIGVINTPQAFVIQLESLGAIVTHYTSNVEADSAMEKQQIDASIELIAGTPHVLMEGSNPAKSKSILLLLQQAIQRETQSANHASPPLVRYMYGSQNMSSFDNFGPVLIGVFAFFFVFMISGVAFLKERTSGTLERLMASPIRRWEIVAGYVIGFGIFTTIQAFLIAWFAVDVLGMMMNGEIVYLFSVTFLLSLTALTLGTFLSAFANTEFQMIQFIPVILVPQVFFSGLFSLDTMAPWLRGLSHIMPLYYGADALRNVMIRGKGFSTIYPDLAVLLGLSVAFIAANVVTLRRYRRI